MLLLAGGAWALAGCQAAATVPDPIQLVRPYWRPALQGAAEAIELLRLMEANTRSIAAGLISLRQYALAASRYGQAASAIGHSLAQLEPPPSATAAHRLLLAGADGIVRVVAGLTAFLEDEDLRRVVTAVKTLSQIRTDLFDFVAAIEDRNSQLAMNEQLSVLGDIQFHPETVTVFMVLVGEFLSTVDVRARLARFQPDAELSSRYPGWAEVGRFGAAADANLSAELWDERGFRVRIELGPDIAVGVTVDRAPLTNRSWRELIWFNDLPFSAVAAAADHSGSTVAVISRSGQIVAINGVGELVWQRDLNFPADGVAIDSDGSTTVGYGFFLAPLDSTGEPLWSQIKDQPDNQIIESIAFADDGLMLVRTSNNRNEGGAFIHRQDGRRWRLDAGPYPDGVGSAKVSSAGSHLAVANFNPRQDPVVAIYGVEDQVTSEIAVFKASSPITALEISVDGSRVVMATEYGLEIYSARDGTLLYRAPLPILGLRIDPLGRIAYVSTPSGLKAYGLDGQLVWSNSDFAPLRFEVSANYLAAITAPTSVSVLTATGSHIGDATTLAPISAIAMARNADILYAASAEQRLQAWRLPPS